MGNLAGHHDSSRATAVNRLLFRETLERRGQAFLLEQLQHGGALATRDNQAVALLQIGRGADFDSTATSQLDRFAMRLKIALQREYTNRFHA